jgi:hypothetical protein
MNWAQDPKFSKTHTTDVASAPFLCTFWRTIIAFSARPNWADPLVYMARCNSEKEKHPIWSPRRLLLLLFVLFGRISHARSIHVAGAVKSSFCGGGVLFWLFDGCDCTTRWEGVFYHVPLELVPRFAWQEDACMHGVGVGWLGGGVLLLRSMLLACLAKRPPPG